MKINEGVQPFGKVLKTHSVNLKKDFKLLLVAVELRNCLIFPY